MINVAREAVSCFHCGLELSGSDALEAEGKFFCCRGCLQVYRLLSQSGLDRYYQLAKSPGRAGGGEDYSYLEDKGLQERLLSSSDGRIAQVCLEVPNLHCASCVYLMENLYRLEGGILRTSVDFYQKRVLIVFERSRTSLARVVRLLGRLGYPPRLNLELLDGGEKESLGKELEGDLIRLAVAGFCFGNVMLFSFPIYLGGESVPVHFQRFFAYLCCFLSLPVLFYSAYPWYQRAWTYLRLGRISLDVPILVGLLALFIQSSYEVLARVGHGYWDSLCGFVFFLLLGRFFQRKFFENISFERDLRSYFPLAVFRQEGGEFRITAVDDLEEGDRIRLRSREIVPSDGELEGGEALFDYSFITGESAAVLRRRGDFILAGARFLGGEGRIRVLRSVDKSFLLSLWRGKVESSRASWVDVFSPYFVGIVIGIGVLSAGYWWWQRDFEFGVFVFFSILIVACPCALALSGPFTYGSFLRLLAKRGIFLKDGGVLERFYGVDAVVFDKTGTLTSAQLELELEWGGLGREERGWVLGVVDGSSHPVSMALGELLRSEVGGEEVMDFFEVEEYPGKGLRGRVEGLEICVGQLSWLSSLGCELRGVDCERWQSWSHLGVCVQGRLEAVYRISFQLRPGWREVLEDLRGRGVELHLLSGDGPQWRHIFEVPFEGRVYFRQGPEDKLDYIRSLQLRGKTVAMVADGINDGPALSQSDVSVVVVEEKGAFSPSGECIVLGRYFGDLPGLWEISSRAMRILKFSVGLGVVYNVVGLGFAVAGRLSPVVAAILMPLSSISVMVFTTLGSVWVYGKVFSWRS